MNRTIYNGRVGLQQRVLPAYRAPFFDLLAEACAGGLGVFAGDPLPQENIHTGSELRVARLTRARNRHFFNPQSVFYRCNQEDIQGWLENLDPDVLIIEANPRYRSNAKAIDWMHERNRPVIGWGLGAPPVSGLSAFWRRRERIGLLNSLDAMIAYSNRGAGEYRALGFPAGRLFVATNAAYPRPTLPYPERPERVSGRLTTLFVGRLQRRKRIDNLLRACAALPGTLQPELSIVGDGPSREALQRLADAIYPAAKFHGALYGDELDRYFAHADLFVLPGTGGLAVQQAMAFGLPVIAAEGDGTQEDLVREGNGWLVGADDVEALTAALKEALSDAPRLRAMGVESYRIVAEEVSIEAMVEVFVEALNRVGSGDRHH